MSDTHFDTIVVGSGFGGSVTAYRLAEAGQRVCLLERGKSYPPESFARRPHEMARNFWDPSRGYQGLFDVWSFRGIEALIASGLGGGSLIYANVLLRKDERWFVHESPVGKGYENWPISRADLDPHYDAVESMMGATRFPFGQPGFDTHKTQALKDAAATLDLEWALPPLAVSFSPRPGEPPVIAEPVAPAPYGNVHGKLRTTCRLCGECDLGCNYGSKNTLDHNYISAACHHGAEVRTRSEVKRIGRRPEGGYTVSYVEHRPDREGVATDTSKLPQTTITADRLVLSAGTLGSPYLLLRNRSAFPNLSKALGSRFCGNGDLLSFVINATEEDGGRRVPRNIEGSRGPVITSYLRVPDQVDGGTGRGYYVEDAGYPAWLDWVVETATLPRTVSRVVRFAGRRVLHHLTRSPRSDLSAEIGYLVGPCTLSSTSMPLLGMGRDVPDGVMKLRRGYLDIDWSTKTSQDYFERVRGTMEGIASALGADFKDSFLWWLKRVITVHPLGGCPMGRHEGEGVVDQWGEVFGYPGLYVADGSVMPGPVGPNPSLTIAAFADRMATRILESAPPARRPVHPPVPVPVPEPEPAPPGPEPAPEPGDGATTSLEFTEEMKGHVTFGETDFEKGAKQGRKDRNFFMFRLTIVLDDVNAFLADPDRQARAGGWVSCEALGGRRPVDRGTFNLFVDTEDPDLKKMLYRLWFTDGSGHPLTMTGFKLVKDDPGFDLWSDTTTLYVRLLAGHVEPDGDGAAEVVASGIITIYLKDFARQLTTFRTRGGSLSDRATALARFGKLFLGDLWDVYGGRASDSAGDSDVRA
ncbi:MAG: GMC family oxidoreductase [Actinomycetota bacterium]